MDENKKVVLRNINENGIRILNMENNKSAHLLSALRGPPEPGIPVSSH